MLLTAEVCGKQVKSDLSVLYVGGSPEIETMIHNPEPAVLEKSVRKRTAAFEKLLRRYFRNVEVVSARDYLPEMSDRYDVTIMDGTPRELQPAQEIVNEEGMIISRLESAYLPEDFDRPMVFIAEAGDIVGTRIGVKTDWYCLCLDADAHHFNKEHLFFTDLLR